MTEKPDNTEEAVAWQWRWEGQSKWNFLDYLPRPDADESEPLFPLSSLETRDARIAVAEAENVKLRALAEESIRLMTKYAREAGEATGKLETSELAGVVDDWKARALKAEARLAEAVGALEKAEQFIVNGIETGHVRLPETSIDPAHETLPAIRKALSSVSASPAEAGLDGQAAKVGASQGGLS